MHKIISLREVVSSLRRAGGEWEWCAAADADYDRASSTVAVKLDFLVQLTGLSPGVERFRPPGLPVK